MSEIPLTNAFDLLVYFYRYEEASCVVEVKHFYKVEKEKIDKEAK